MFDLPKSLIHIDPFLLPSEVCDSDSKLILDKAKEIVDEAPYTEAAYLIRDYVRNNIKYRLDFCTVKASETLMKGTGMCTNKANLQVALLRSLGIPAGYGLVYITKKVFEDDSDPEIYKKISEPTTHVFACVWLPELNRFCYHDATEQGKDYQKYMVELPWTGETMYKPCWIRGNIHIHSNLDHLFKAATRYTAEEFEKQNIKYDKKEAQCTTFKRAGRHTD